MFEQVQETTLPNGLRVITSSVPHVASVSFGIWVGVGSRYESKAMGGASHFIEHMLFKGTRKRTALDLSQAIEGKGGYLNAFTQEESTCFYARVTCPQLESAFDTISDMCLHSLFNAEELEKERHVVLEEMMMYGDQPQHLVHELLERNLWKGHALGRPIIGNSDSVPAMSRRDLTGFWKQHYVPSNMVCSFAGNVSHEECVRLVKARMGRLKAARRPVARKCGDRVPQGTYASAEKPIEQAHLAMGIRLFGRHDERRYALKVLNTVLGENMSSRLFQVVREKHGLAYSIHSSRCQHADQGALVISAGLEKGSASKALKLILRELERLRQRKISQREMELARDYAIGQVQLGLESMSNQMTWLGDNLMSFNQFMSPADAMASLSAVTAEEVQQVAQDCLVPERMTLSLVAPDVSAKVAASLSGQIAKF
jgi:predicted Zn-dependent peptidase